LVKGVGETYLAILQNNGIHSVLDLLLHFPFSYLNFKSISRKIEPGKRRVYKISVIQWRLSRFYAKRLSVLKIKAKVEQDLIFITIFNKPYLQNILKKGAPFFIFGILEHHDNTFTCSNPSLFVFPQSEDIVPIYPNISTIKSGKIKQLTKNALAVLHDNREDLPLAIVTKYSFPALLPALQAIHFPTLEELENIPVLKKRFIYHEFLRFQLELHFVRASLTQVQRIHHFQIDHKFRQSMNASLKFQLTRDQLSAFEDIVNDMKSPNTMRRIIQGEVGSGKTIIAFLTLLIAANSGCQGALLVPTEVLATQHFQRAREFFQEIRVEILTGSTPSLKKRDIKTQLLNGQIDILIGTHAILQQQLRFKNIGLMVIDEQHKFGVAQRASLYYKGEAMDVLVTTATPIPRTMRLSLYKDLDVSTIKTKPEGRRTIITKIVGNRDRDKFYQNIGKAILKGNKAFIVLPLIEDSDFFPDLRSLKGETQYLKQIFAPIRTAIISSKTPIDQREKAISRFRRGEIKALISTTVIEIGIDVTDATIMVIENADRYGLAQLHQLRGRVGRGKKQSFCYLIPSANITEAGEERLSTLASTQDGFRIAEKDLEMRGGGIISGLEQSGYFDFKVGNIKTDYDQLILAQRDASQILATKSWQQGFVPSFLNSLKKKLKQISFS